MITSAVAGLKSRIEALETGLERATLLIEEAEGRARVEREQRTSEADDSDAFDRPIWSNRVASAEFQVERAKREAERTTAELDRHRALMASAERRDTALAISRYEAKAAAAVEADRKIAGVLRTALSEVRAALPEFRTLVGEAAHALDRVPPDVREALDQAVLSSPWAAYGAEDLLARVAKLLQVEVTS